MFRKHRIPKMERAGGTEFFNIKCLNDVINFIKNNDILFEYSKIINGIESFKNEEFSIPHGKLDYDKNSDECMHISEVNISYNFFPETKEFVLTYSSAEY